MKTNSNQAPQHWIVGLDHSPRSAGAARWGSWLSRRASRPIRLTALHAGEIDDFKDDHPGVGSPLLRAREATEASLRSLDVWSDYDQVAIVDTDSTVETILASAADEGSRGLILGRNQPSDSWTLVSLGSIARKVLRATNEPVFVVPPDYEPPLTPGPILVGLSPTQDARAAIEVAQALGEDLRLPVEYVHVIPNVARFVTTAGAYAHGGPGVMHTSFKEDARTHAETWMKEQGIDSPLHVEVGDTTATLDITAKRLEATMLVTGSRHMSTLERLFHRSVGSSLAAVSHVPTLVVPPEASSTEDAATG